MLEKIREVLFQKYQKSDCKGIFLSAFGSQNEILVSTGVLYADKGLDDVLDTIYRGVVGKQNGIETVVVDVVIDTKEIMDLSEISQLSVKEYGIAIIEGNKSGVILPNTKGVNDFATGIKLINEKNGLSGNAKIYVFQTDRIIVS